MTFSYKTLDKYIYIYIYNEFISKILLKKFL